MAEILAVLGGLLGLAGLSLMALAALGGVRLADLFTRLHAAALGSWGCSIALIGLAFLARVPAQALLLLLLGGLWPVLQAASRHALADAARVAGDERRAPRDAEDAA